MPRRTGLDTVFDNETGPRLEDVLALASEGTGEMDEFPLDREDYDQKREGIAGDFGNFGEANALDEEEFEEAISKAIANAEDYVDMELSPDREFAARYYRGESFGNEVDGRSAFVMSEVRDTVLAIMPSLLRIFCGPKEPVLMTTTPGTPSEQGTQQTAYISHIINKDNDGFMIHHSAFKDALIRKTGTYHWWFEEKEVVEIETKTGLNESAYALEQLEIQESSSEDENLEYEVVITDERPDTTAKGSDPLEGMGIEGEIPPEIMAEAGIEPPTPQFIRDIRVYTRRIVKRHRVTCVPPEEFLISPVASANLDEFPLVGRRQMKTIGELVALGHDEDDIREKIGGQGSRLSNLQLNQEATDRNGAQLERLFDNDFAAVDPASEYVKYCEVYVLIDADGDGIRERHKVCTVGDNNAVIFDEIVGGMVPYAVICPDPEPHTPTGYSVADHNLDMQEVKSEMVRGILDNLAQSIVGRTAIVEGKVNIDDALSNDAQQVIRTREQGAIWSLSHPFTGMNAIPVLSYLDQVQAKRTGVFIGATGGLSADVLQSTSKEAAQSMVESTDERPEMIARIFAEGGIKRLYKGLLHQVIKHQDVKRTLRLRGREVTIDPRTFNADVDFEINIAGKNSSKQRIQALTMIGVKQQEIYEKYGPGNAMVSLQQISNCIEDWIVEHEVSDVSRYFSRVTPEVEQKINQEHAERKPPPTPEQLLFQAQMAKVQGDNEAKRRADMIKVVLEMAKLAQKEDESESDYYLKAAELLGKFGVEVNEQEMRLAQMTDDSADKLAVAAAEQGQKQLAPPGAPQQ